MLTAAVEKKLHSTAIYAGNVPFTIDGAEVFSPCSDPALKYLIVSASHNRPARKNTLNLRKAKNTTARPLRITGKMRMLK